MSLSRLLMVAHPESLKVSIFNDCHYDGGVTNDLRGRLVEGCSMVVCFFSDLTPEDTIMDKTKEQNSKMAVQLLLGSQRRRCLPSSHSSE